MSDNPDDPMSGPMLAGPRLDGFVNEVTGLGTVAQDKTRGGLAGGPAFCLYIMSYPEASARYRGSDLGRTIVDKPCDEMLRRGWDVEVQPSDEEIVDGTMDATRSEPRRAAAGWRKVARRTDSAVTRKHAERNAERWDAFGGAPMETTPPAPPGPLPKINDKGIELGEAIEKWAERLPNNCGGGGAGAAISQALRYERAYGGGCVFVGVDDGGRPLTEPLDPKRVKRVTHLTALRGGFDGPVTMWRPYRFAIDAKYGLPEIFQVQNATVPIAAVPAPGEGYVSQNYPDSPSGPTLFYVHSSRFLIFDGEPTSIEVRQEMRGWGDSIFTRVGDPLVQFEQNWNAAGLLMQEASTADVGIEGFTRALAEKGVAARDAFIQYARLQSIMRSVARTNYHDAKEIFKRDSVSFAGIPDILDRCVDRIAAAAGMPVSVLFGNLKGGLGASEDPSSRGWYATIAARQESRLRDPLEYLYRLGWQSKEGPTRGVEPEKWKVIFRPLWQLTELEQADLRQKTSTADASDIDKGIVTPEEVAATRYGGAEYNPGTIVIDMEGRNPAMMPGASVAGMGASPAANVPIELTATAQGAIVKVNEARASIGLGPLLLPTGQPDIDGELTIAAYSVKHSAVIAGATQTEEGTPVEAQGATEPLPVTASPFGKPRATASKEPLAAHDPTPPNDPEKMPPTPENEGPTTIVIPPIKSMPTDPITRTPTSSPTVLDAVGHAPAGSSKGGQFIAAAASAAGKVAGHAKEQAHIAPSEAETNLGRARIVKQGEGGAGKAKGLIEKGLHIAANAGETAAGLLAPEIAIPVEATIAAVKSEKAHHVAEQLVEGAKKIVNKIRGE